jgi:putative two-component system response regulator
MGRLLIVDDEEPLRRSLRRVLEGGGHTVAEASSVEHALRELEVDRFELVICDINMPGGSGLELVRSISSGHPDVAVVMLTGVDDPAVADEALDIGAYGYLVKPLERNEALINVASALRRRELELARREYVQELEGKVVSRTSALRDALGRLEESESSIRGAEREAVSRLVIALTLRSEETGAHIRRVGRYAEMLARRAGAINGNDEEVRLAAMLHDVGKIGIPDSILLKPGPLRGDEFEIIKRHPALGSRILSGGKAPVVTLGAEIALSHHERWDGRGYPDGVAGDSIPLMGRIVGLADVFDALTSERVYRGAMPIAQAFELMRSERGRHFDPDLLDLFLGAEDEIKAIRAAHPDPRQPD